MRGACGFAIWNVGRRPGGVVKEGTGTEDGGALASEKVAGGSGIGTSGASGAASNVNREGKDESGEGGGSTNDVVRRGAAFASMVNGAGKGGSTSVSYDGITLLNKDDRRDTLVFFPLITLPGDLRGDLQGDFVLVLLVGRVGELETLGVGGNSASIISTCHVRFSSSSLIRSACIDLHGNV